MTEREIIAAVVGALNSPTRPRALAPLAFVKYPLREIQPQQLPDGSYTVRLVLWGYEYKHRGPRPKNPPVIDTEEVRLFLNALFPNGLFVSSVEDQKTHLILTIKIF